MKPLLAKPRLKSQVLTMDDEHQQLSQGGEPVLADLFSEYRERLKRLIDFRLDQRLKSRVDTSDVLQESFIELARRYQEYLKQPKVSFFVWARQLTIQTLIDVQRRHFGQKRTPTQEAKFPHYYADDTSCSIAQFFCDQMISPSRAAIREEEIERLHAALDSMDQTDREVLALRHFEHLSNSEVAETLGLSISAASNRYVRAMTRLREILQEFDQDL